MNSELPVMLMAFAVVAVVSETLARSGADVVDGSVITVNGLNSTRTRYTIRQNSVGEKDR